MMATPTAEMLPAGIVSAVDLLALIALAFGLVLCVVQRLAPSVRLLQAQALVLAILVGVLAGATGAWHLWLAAGLTLIVKVVLVPRILLGIIDRLKVRRELEPVLPVRLTLLAAAGLTVLAYWVVQPLDLPGVLAGQTLPVAIACMLLGGLQMVTRRKAVMQLIGLMVMENGLYLAAMGVTLGMPLLVELGIFFDLLIGVLVMGVIIFRISQTFDSIDTDRLRRLRH